MYLDIYKKVIQEPEEKTTKNIAKKFKLSKEQVNKLVREGNIDALKFKPGETTTEQVIQQYSKIFNDFQNDLSVEQTRSDLTEETKPSEIFTDGDTSNSDFDLLYDLNIIEIILFNQASASQFGGAFVSPPFELIDEEEIQEIEELFELEEIEEEIPKAFVEEGIEPLACFDDTTLDDALDDFAAQEAAADIEEIVEEDITEIDGFPAATADPWENVDLCPDGAFFCIDILFDSSKAKLYKKDDNCVACHVEKINEALDKLLQKPLSPNKMTGNLYEASKCKKSFTNLPANISVILKAVPALQPQNQNIYHNTNIEREWLKYNERTKPYWYETNPNPRQPLEDRMTQRILKNASPNPTLVEINTRSNTTFNTVNDKTNQSAFRKEIETKLSTKYQLYQLIINEMASMNTYFKSMKETLESIKKPCDTLSNKAQCS